MALVFSHNRHLLHDHGLSGVNEEERPRPRAANLLHCESRRGMPLAAFVFCRPCSWEKTGEGGRLSHHPRTAKERATGTPNFRLSLPPGEKLSTKGMEVKAERRRAVPVWRRLISAVAGDISSSELWFEHLAVVLIPRSRLERRPGGESEFFAVTMTHTAGLITRCAWA